MQIQACKFQRESGSNFEVGIAKLNSGFNCYDVDWIVDLTGNIVTDLYHYKLIDGPLKHLEVLDEQVT